MSHTQVIQRKPHWLVREWQGWSGVTGININELRGRVTIAGSIAAFWCACGLSLSVSRRKASFWYKFESRHARFPTTVFHGKHLQLSYNTIQYVLHCRNPAYGKPSLILFELLFDAWILLNTRSIVYIPAQVLINFGVGSCCRKATPIAGVRTFMFHQFAKLYRTIVGFANSQLHHGICNPVMTTPLFVIN